MRTFVVPDIHGKIDTLRHLLREAGVIDQQDRRIENDIHVVQLGDLANCVAADVRGDVMCLSTVGHWIDAMLVGNHEHPYWGGPTFGGFAKYTEVESELRRIEREGMLKAAHLVDDVLITHAGFVPTHGIEDVFEAHTFANSLWEDDKTHPLFSNISYMRGGRHSVGGILWSDWTEKKADEFKQVVGHTPQKNGVQFREYDTGNWSMCLDVGAKHGTGAAGLMISGSIKRVIYSPGHSGNH